MLHPDLFGGDTPITTNGTDRAHAAPVGSGPTGQICGSCSHFVRRRYHDRTYFKCGVVRETHGAGTDIRRKDPACRFWNERMIP